MKAWFKAFIDRLSAALGPEDLEKRRSFRLRVFRIIAVANLVLGVSYIVWRYTSTLNLDALWFAIPVVLAETYGFFDHLLFIFQVWKPARRVVPPPLEDVTLDVFITTYNEPVELVRLTAEAAMRIRWPCLNVYILDDRARPAMRDAAREIGCGYITRGDEWAGKARHAKAGNVSNALLQTDGDFILTLDADQIPAPEIAERTMGYFRDPKVSFVQTPQYFYNIPPTDPFGSDAPLFYGPIQQGKDGWNAAFFCGSNALLRREALMQLGLTDYVQDMEARVRRSIGDLRRGTRSRAATPAQRAALAALRPALAQARQALRQGQALMQVSDMVREAVATAQRRMAEGDMAEIAEALRELAAAGDAEAAEVSGYIDRHRTDLAAAISASPESLGLSAQAVDDLSLTRSDEAIPVIALSTISITEDMATAMRLHSLGWRSVFHPEILAYGLAPEDLGSALRQRMRWAQGTLQVLLTSGQSTYVSMLLAIAIILGFGLVLTVRGVTQELELARMKSDFVSTVSHEFKSPLTSIRQLAEMLQTGRVGSEERRQRYYDVLVEQSARLSALVTNVLDLARIEEGRKDFRFEPVDLGSLIR